MLKSQYKIFKKSKYERKFFQLRHIKLLIRYSKNRSMNSKKAEILKAYAFLKPIRSPFRASDQIYFKSTYILRGRNL